ncbi:insulin-degrading enzyme, putative [Ichthyophthirius multifiliis]|uniref:Insulin-degrading enzyme, putative n=1 Tax=Ichthyophthirius multifiliis TaxID=5932 RepID=G0R2H5_ICHMU|nr:insulin-degrading enzyme, putative [Ichthyophthirius multifiliis]EGR28343.1 insulin-degrading enzyme, putative [Ichthyophthirius multifiliis]|eukprot:XP_004027688.1 insulin-degrading enzyme, putative [Ichthyophthirius multifiliis]
MIKNLIKKSLNDSYVYEYIKLQQNNLDCILIKDPQADKSTCSLTVNVGSLEDPQHLQGLAHFCEHMLFLGTQKYPQENRFSQFFKSPLFTESCTQRELQAINNENKKNFLIDARRQFQIIRNMSKQDNAFGKFSTGNTETLLKNDLRENLILFYEKYYSANLMKLAIYSKNENLEKYLDFFKEINNKNQPNPIYKEFPFEKKTLSKYIKYIPVQKDHRINFKWYLNFDQEDYKNKNFDFLQHLWGHEGPNSLLSLLIKEDLAFELFSGSSVYMKNFVEFNVNITLSEQGQKNITKVVQYVFYFCQFLKEIKEEQFQRIWKEIKLMKNILFDFKEKSDPLNLVVNLSKIMHDLPIENVLQYPYLMETFSFEKIQEIVQNFTLENLLIVHSSPLFSQEECNLIENHYQTNYSIQNFSQEIEQIYQNPLNCTNIGLPPKNIFIPENFEVIKEESVGNFPKIIYEKENMRAYFKGDDGIFKTPKGVFQLNIYYKIQNSFLFTKEERILFNYIYYSLFKNFIREIQYMAQLANLVDSYLFQRRKITLNCQGFSDKLLDYSYEIVQKLISFNSQNNQEFFEFSNFERFLQKKLLLLQNFYIQSPHNFEDHFCNNLLDNNTEEKIKLFIQFKIILLKNYMKNSLFIQIIYYLKVFLNYPLLAIFNKKSYRFF